MKIKVIDVEVACLAALAIGLTIFAFLAVNGPSVR